MNIHIPNDSKIITEYKPQMKGVKIALDYDGTFSADPEMWLRFIADAKSNGHDIRCVTMRYDIERDSMDKRLLEAIPVIFTCRKSKKKAARMQGFDPDIWIDDTPEWIFEDSI